MSDATVYLDLHFAGKLYAYAGLGGSVGCMSGDEEVVGAIPAESGSIHCCCCRWDSAFVGSTAVADFRHNILTWRLIMKYFLLSFSPSHRFKKGSCQFLAKEYG